MYVTYEVVTLINLAPTWPRAGITMLLIPLPTAVRTLHPHYYFVTTDLYLLIPSPTSPIHSALHLATIETLSVAKSSFVLFVRSSCYVEFTHT